MTIPDQITLVLSQQLVDYLLAGGTKQRVARQTQAKCIFCSQPHWSDECPNCKALQERREKLKGSCYACLKQGHMSINCIKDKICAHCGTSQKSLSYSVSQQ